MSRGGNGSEQSRRLIRRRPISPSLSGNSEGVTISSAEYEALCDIADAAESLQQSLSFKAPATFLATTALLEAFARLEASRR